MRAARERQAPGCSAGTKRRPTRPSSPIAQLHPRLRSLMWERLREIEPLRSRILNPSASGFAPLARASLPAAEAMALTTKLEDRTMMNEAIDHRPSRHSVGKDLRPLFEREVRGDGDARAFIAL